MKLYNTLTRKKEEFKPLNDKEVTIYVCGPTVYNNIHIGNARPLIIFDTLRRYFKYKGMKVKYVMNFTDIDDKMIKKANEEGTTVKKIADRYINEFFKDTEGLGILEEETLHPRATEHMDDIIKFVKQLEDKGAAYNVDGNVYFDISKAKNYGKLSKKNIEELMSGARIEINKDKKNPMDFVLWKKEKSGEPSWDSPWGKGRPGWHIECSVMAKELLGETIDIHAGGDDLQFPHHENEIAQSETLSGKPFANYWLHNAMINIEDQKMSKSAFNFSTVKEIKEKFDLEVLRIFMLSAHYRNPINFSVELMKQAQKGLDRLYNGKKNLEYLMEKAKNKEMTEEEVKQKNKIKLYKEKFFKSMDDDLNTADAIAVLFEIVKYANLNLDERSPKSLISYTYDTLMELSEILGLLLKKDELLNDEIVELIEKRAEARKNKNFELADEIRDNLRKQGIILEDTSKGVKWKRV